jgi:rhodanese-related sulfurtransferase/polyisoprenoid-binding protein YceI
MDFKTTTPLALHERLDKGDIPLIIDTLTPEHYALAHLPGARHACVFEVDFLKQVAAITSDKSVEIILYGSNPRTHDANAAAGKLEREGYSDITILFGGLAAWRDAGLALEGEDPKGRDEAVKSFQPPKGEYGLVAEESRFDWTGRNHNGGHHGILKFKSGGLVFDEGKLSGSFVLDMESIKNLDLEGDELQPVLISHLKSDDFFFTRLFPEARFSITNATPLEGVGVTLPNYRIGGDLELRGVKRYLEFEATLSNLDDGRLAMEAHFDFDRTLWGMIYGSSRFFEHLGYHLVFDMISVSFRLVLSKD